MVDTPEVPAPLTVFRWNNRAGNRYIVVAAATKALALEALRSAMRPEQVPAVQVAPTGISTECCYAMNAPGTLFWRPLNAPSLDHFVRFGEAWVDPRTHFAEPVVAAPRGLDVRAHPRDDSTKLIHPTDPQDEGWGEACEVVALRVLLRLGDELLAMDGHDAMPFASNLATAAHSTPNEFRAAMRRARFSTERIEEELRRVVVRTTHPSPEAMARRELDDLDKVSMFADGVRAERARMVVFLRSERGLSDIKAKSVLAADLEGSLR